MNIIFHDQNDFIITNKTKRIKKRERVLFILIITGVTVIINERANKQTSVILCDHGTSPDKL